MITTRVEIFENIGWNIPGGNFLGEIFPRRDSPGGRENICKEFSSVHALTLVFIRKIFILQTHSLRV